MRCSGVMAESTDKNPPARRAVDAFSGWLDERIEEKRDLLLRAQELLSSQLPKVEGAFEEARLIRCFFEEFLAKYPEDPELAGVKRADLRWKPRDVYELSIRLSREAWVADVVNHKTDLGYWSWAQNKVASIG